MGIQVNIGQAKDRFSELVAAAERGEEVVIARAGVPVANLVGRSEARDGVAERRRRWMGSFAGKLSADAGDLFLEPTFTEEEIERFGPFPGEAPPE